MNINLEDENRGDDVDIVDAVVEVRVPRQVFVGQNCFQTLSEREFFTRFRLTKLTAVYVLEQIEQQLEYAQDRNNSISPINQLLLTLRVYATGGHLLSVGDFTHCDKSTVSRIVKKVTRPIAHLSGQYIYMPRNQNEVARRQNDFYEIAQFPKVIGAIDGSHVRINSQGGNDAEVFRNRKGYFSINIQAVASANLLFQDLVARWPGSTHDATIFINSRLRYRFDNGEFRNAILLGDSGYMKKPYLLTPFLNPQTRGHRQFNIRHIQTRVKVENLFGVWKWRFPIIAYGCHLKLETCLEAIISTAILHNIARLRGEPEPPPENEVMQHQLQQLILAGDIPNHDIEHQNILFDNRRDLVENYFNRI